MRFNTFILKIALCVLFGCWTFINVLGQERSHFEYLRDLTLLQQKTSQLRPSTKHFELSNEIRTEINSIVKRIDQSLMLSATQSLNEIAMDDAWSDSKRVNKLNRVFDEFDSLDQRLSKELLTLEQLTIVGNASFKAATENQDVDQLLRMLHLFPERFDLSKEQLREIIELESEKLDQSSQAIRNQNKKLTEIQTEDLKATQETLDEEQKQVLERLVEIIRSKGDSAENRIDLQENQAAARKHAQASNDTIEKCRQRLRISERQVGQLLSSIHSDNLLETTQAQKNEVLKLHKVLLKESEITNFDFEHNESLPEIHAIENLYAKLTLKFRNELLLPHQLEILEYWAVTELLRNHNNLWSKVTISKKEDFELSKSQLADLEKIAKHSSELSSAARYEFQQTKFTDVLSEQGTKAIASLLSREQMQLVEAIAAKN